MGENCRFIERENLRCWLYHLKDMDGYEALTQKYKDRVCNNNGSSDKGRPCLLKQELEFELARVEGELEKQRLISTDVEELLEGVE